MKIKQYIRDGRAPVPKSAIISKVMSANKGRGTTPEVTLRKALWQAELKGYRLNWKKAPGRPDIAFPGRKLAIFVNGCFWHRCPQCDLPIPKSNPNFWEQKFKNNLERDKMKASQLQTLGWTVLTIWECEIKKNLEAIVNNIKIHKLNLQPNILSN